MAMSAIVLAWSGTPDGAKAPSDHCRVSGAESNATPASSWALARIFPVVEVIAAETPGDGLVLKPWPVPNRARAEAVGVGRHDLDVKRGDAQIVGNLPGVVGLVAVRLGGEAEHHLPRRVNPEKHRAVGLVGHR